jgi:uncharacterized damage-inducible protein DinB
MPMQHAEMIAYARAMASYNSWMNGRLYETCAQLSDEQRKQDVSAFFKSIHGTLNHLLLADRIWMGRFTATTFACASLRDELYANFEQLRREREQEDARISAWVDGLQTGDLQAELHFTSVVNPQPRCYPLWFALSHFFNHQTHHRGQITALLSQFQVDPGVTDLLALPEFQR